MEWNLFVCSHTLSYKNQISNKLQKSPRGWRLEKFETDFDLRFFDFLCDERNETLKNGSFNMTASLAQTGKNAGGLIYLHKESNLFVRCTF